MVVAFQPDIEQERGVTSMVRAKGQTMLKAKTNVGIILCTENYSNVHLLGEFEIY
jgi:hypothetical protein